MLILSDMLRLEMTVDIQRTVLKKLVTFNLERGKCWILDFLATKKPALHLEYIRMKHKAIHSLIILIESM